MNQNRLRRSAACLLAAVMLLFQFSCFAYADEISDADGESSVIQEVEAAAASEMEEETEEAAEEEEAAAPEEAAGEAEEAAEEEEAAGEAEEATAPEEAAGEVEEAAAPEKAAGEAEEAAPEKAAGEAEEAAPEEAAGEAEEAAAPEEAAGEAEKATAPEEATGEAEEAAAPDDSLEGMTEEGKAIVARLQEEEPPESTAADVYAILYEDGTLVFQSGSEPKGEGAVTAAYPVDMDNSYSVDGVAPWYEDRELIRKVDFADKILPSSVSCWFMDCSNLAEFTNLANLDVSQATTMRNTFSGCSSLRALELTLNTKGIWDTSNVTDMRGIFSGCSSLTKLDVSTWKTSSVTNMEEAFAGCEGLTELGLVRWNTSSVTDMSGAFMDCSSLTELDLSGWDTSNVTDMARMFEDCRSLNILRASNSFVTPQVTNSADMFAGCEALTGGAGTAYSVSHSDAAYARMDASGAPGYFTPGVFVILYDDGLMVFQDGDTPEEGRTVTRIYPLDWINGYGMAGRQMPDMPWYEMRDSITRVDFADKIQPRVAVLWFYNCVNLTEVLHGENLDVSQANSLQNLFYGCQKLETVDVSTWDTSNVTSVHALFYNCFSLQSVDVSAWDTSKMTDISGMFFNCASLTELDVSGFDTSNVEHFGSMFRGVKVTSLDVSQWDTSHALYLGGIFRECSGLTELDLSSWDTSSAGQCANMFYDATNLQTIWVSERFVTSNVTQEDQDIDMFTNCFALVGGNGTAYDEDHTDKTYARIDAAGAPGYFTAKDGAAPESYTVSFDANGGSGTMDSVTVTEGSSFTLPQNGFTPPAQKKFHIWAVENVEYEPGSVLTITGPVTVTAQWETGGSSAPVHGCYVATAVYGSYDCPEVWTLRRFRDNVLAKTWYGRLFIRFYYAVSPTAVRWFGSADWFQTFFRDRLDGLVESLQDSGFASTPYQDRDW